MGDMRKNNTHWQMKKAKRTGLTELDLLRMKEIAKKHAYAMEGEAVERAFFLMLTIPLNILVNDYWSCKARKKPKGSDKTYAEEFTEAVVSLYQSWEAGVVTDNELLDLLKDYTGMDITAHWLNRKANT